jgi:hypothetical protein
MFKGRYDVKKTNTNLISPGRENGCIEHSGLSRYIFATSDVHNTSAAFVMNMQKEYSEGPKCKTDLRVRLMTQ